MIGLASLSALVVLPAWGDAVPQTLPFSQNWTNIGLITTNDAWTGVPGIEGFRGDGLASTGADPQTVLAADDPGVIDVNANQTTPNTFSTGGVTEFHITDPVVALSGSGTADAPYIRLSVNTTGQTNVSVHYLLRDIDGSSDNAVQQVALQYRVGASGTFTNIPGAYVADATTGPNLATKTTDVCVVLPVAAENQSLVQLRIMTVDAPGPGGDEWVGIDDIQVSTAPCPPRLTIDDVAVTEGDSGTVTANFTVNLSQPAPPGGVTFDIATADGTTCPGCATTADNDYVANTLVGQLIPAGQQTFPFNVTVNGDMNVEPNETFQVNVTNVVGTGVVIADPQALGTINNDDVTLTKIHDIQGNGATSPIVGSVVSTRGIVTGVKSNGFFIQEPDATVDADPMTSEGILVFTSTTPPPAAVVGNLVQVTGTVQEFFPTADPLQPPLTELGGSPTVISIGTGNPLPTPTPLTATFPDPSGAFDQLERIEGMRASVASLTVTGPTLGNVTEPSATATSTGVYYGVVTGVARPSREAGIPAPDPPPSGGGTIPPIPRFDSNPERIRVDSDGQVGGPLTDVGAGALVTGLVGPLDYTFRTYTILPDLSPAPVVTGGPVATPATAPTNTEFTVAGFNLERFFDTVDDPAIGEPVLTPTAFANRLAKTSLAIRDFLRYPDVLGVIEVENLTTLQALAAKINADAVAASQPDPQYVAFLTEGNDVGGIDVGFLVKTMDVDAGAPVVPRVEVLSVTQENAAEIFVEPTPPLPPSKLNDRPTLRLEAVVHHPNGNSFSNLTVLVNHLRSLNGVNSEAAGSNGWPTEGARVRAKRQQQAESLANLIQACQTGSASACLPTIVNRRMVVLGDFNAFEVNDGLVDSMDTLLGTPVPDNQTAVPGDGTDLVSPNLTMLFDTLPTPADHYSYVFDGNVQSLDHVLVNDTLVLNTVARRIEHPRIDADFPQTARNNPATAERISDHEPVVAYFGVADFPVELQSFSIE